MALHDAEVKHPEQALSICNMPMKVSLYIVSAAPKKNASPLQAQRHSHMNLFLILLFGRIIGIQPSAKLGMAVGQHDRVSWSEDDTRTMSGPFFFLKKKKL